MTAPMSSTNTTPQQEAARPAIIGPATAPPPRIQQRPISGFHFRYLQQQVKGILENGGSEADAIRWLELEGAKPPKLPDLPQDPAEAEKPGLLRGISMRALQGITLGFGDEAMGAMLGVLTGEGARNGIDTYREELRLWNEDHKKLGFAAEIAGGVLGFAAVGAIAGSLRALAGLGAKAAPTIAAVKQSATLGRRALAATGQGAAFGALSGAGHATGDFSQISDRVREGVFGAIVGGVASPTLVGAGRVAGTVVRPLARAGTRGLTSIQKAIPGIGTPEQHARELLVRSIVDDGIDIAEARARAIAMQQTGTPVSVLDLAGDKTMQLARNATELRSPEKTKAIETLLGRQAEQGERLSAGLFRRIFRDDKLGLRNAYETEDALITLRKSASDPHYRAAFQENVTLTPRMKELLMHPEIRKAYHIGRQLSIDEDIAGIGHGLPVPAIPDAPGMPPDVLRRLIPESLPVRGLDYMKRGLQSVMKGLERSDNPIDKRGKDTVGSMLREILDEADKQVNSYATARSIFSDASEALDAVALGRTFTRKAPEVVAREINNLPPNIRDFYRIGSAQTLYEQVSPASKQLQDVATKYFGGTLFRKTSLEGQRIRALFPEAPDVAESFMRKVAAEARVSQTTKQSVGRAVSQRVEQAEDVVEGSIPTVRATAGVAIANIARTGIVRARTGFAQDVSDELSSIMLRGLDDPAELHALLDVLEHTQSKLFRRSKATGAVARAIGQTAGMIR